MQLINWTRLVSQEQHVCVLFNQIYALNSTEEKKKKRHFLTTLKALAGAGNELVSSKYFSHEKCFACG